MSPRIHRLPAPRGLKRRRLGQPLSVTVVGGGLAGIAAAMVLAERGATVTLIEKEAGLGGRVGAWPTTLADGSTLQMERGFHAFFRQYYNVRGLLRRVDPKLERLVPLADYPLVGPGGAVESFANLPKRPPFNVAAVVARSPHMRWRDVLGVDKRAAVEMLTYDPIHTYARFDDMSAHDYLESLRFPPFARRMLFDVFAHSFFNPEKEMSAGELLMMFHFYFTGNPEGLVFDVLDDAFSTALLEPLAQRLRSLGVALRTETAVEAVAREGAGFAVTAGGETHACDGLVLAVSVPALKGIVGASPDLRADAALAAGVDSLDVTAPFAVWRLWLDRPTAPGRYPFIGTAGMGRLDNISCYHLLERESAEWARRTGGSVVELHGYGIEGDFTDDGLKAEYRRLLDEIYPETRDAGVVDERYLVRRDCPAFRPGSHRLRPSVQTPIPGLMLAGDFVKTPFPSALMERAVASGYLAANALLRPFGVAGEPVLSVPPRGLLASTLGPLLRLAP